MSEAGPPTDRLAPAPGLTLADLQALGAPRLDPVRFCYLQALARRAAAQQGAARQALATRLAWATEALAAQCRQALADAGQALPGVLARHPGAATDLRRLLAAADLPGLRRLTVQLDARSRPRPLADLLRRLDRPAPVGAGAEAGQAHTELKALQAFRSIWSRLSAERQLARSLDQLPQNPGPLNSQLLALRALQQMQALSPAYLQRFMAQVEALLWLDAAGSAGTLGGAPAPPRRRSAGKGARPSRSAGPGG